MAVIEIANRRSEAASVVAMLLINTFRTFEEKGGNEYPSST